MLEKINRMQWSKLMHRTYTFTPASSHQRVHPTSKVIVEPRLWFSRCPIHRSLSHLWQSIQECKINSDGSLFTLMMYTCSFYFRVVLDMLYLPPNSLTNLRVILETSWYSIKMFARIYILYKNPMNIIFRREGRNNIEQKDDKQPTDRKMALRPKKTKRRILGRWGGGGGGDFRFFNLNRIPIYILQS